jgi:hypothetical protein
VLSKGCVVYIGTFLDKKGKRIEKSTCLSLYGLDWEVWCPKDFGAFEDWKKYWKKAPASYWKKAPASHYIGWTGTFGAPMAAGERTV